MTKLARFWRSLESMPGLTAVTAEWKLLMGPEYDQVKHFLRPNGKLAMGYPCLRNPPCGCGHTVIHHAPDDIVAVCECEPRQCDPIQLTKSDIALYEFNTASFAEAIVSALQVTSENFKIEGLHMTWRIGTYKQQTGSDPPVFITMQIEPDDFWRVVDHLLALNDKPFILLKPARYTLKPAYEGLLQRGRFHIFALEDILVLDDQDKFISEHRLDSFFIELHPPSGSDAKPQPDRNDWSWSGLPESLKSLAQALPTDTTISAYDLRERLGREPSQVLYDHGSGPWKEWIQLFVGHKRGFYWLKSPGS